MNLHKMIEICLKDDNMHIFVMINALICINNYVITCINIMLLTRRDREVVDFTRSRVKNYSKLTNFRKFTRIEGYNGKYGSNPQGI